MVNDTRVFPARLLGHKDSGGKVELLRGQTSRHKIIMLHGFKPEEVLQRLS